MKTIKVMDVSEVDFMHLWGTACEVCNDLRAQEEDGRFIHVDTHTPMEICPTAKWAYWFENYAQVLFAKYFLISNGYLCQVALDEHDETYMAVIFSDYDHEKGQ